MKRCSGIFGPARPLSIDRQAGFLSSRQAFVLLALIFMAPTFVAWVMHFSTEEGWRPEGTTNRGNLIHPARPLTLPADLQAGEVSLNAYLQGLWTLVYIGDADCDAVCSGNLYKMRQVRLAQNENIRRVQRLFLVTGETVPATLAGLLETEYPDMTVVTLPVSRLDEVADLFAVDEITVPAAERVYIVDPLGNLMMYYGPDVDPRDMLKDLQKLLKYSKIG
jgi:cytochrome oxidase Cu insertion factor (SCO1/SenC/PrrC family)